MSDETKPDLPSTAEDTANTALDAVTDVVLDTTIPAPIRRNALKAFDRLCSALIDVPVGALERRSAEKRAESEARIKIIRESADQIAQQMRVDPEYARIAVNKYGQKILREQVNLDKISAIAANELKADISNGSTSQGTNEPNLEQSTGSTNQDANSREEKTISDVWINIFETEARPQNIEEGQILFGRILAGEIKNPGSYSILTLKTLGQLDQNIATLFKKLCSVCVVLGHLPSKYIRDARVCFLDEKQGKETLSKYGLGNEQLHVLEEYGLIPSSFYHSEFPYHLCISIPNNPALIPFHHQGRDWILVPLDEQRSQDFKLSGIAFSGVGRELFHIVDQDPMPEYTEDLKKFFAEQNLSMVKINIQ